MEKLVDEGLVKSIGLSNFNQRQIAHVLAHCRIRPVNLQVEIHANFPNTSLVDYAQSVGLTVTAYAPLGSPGGFRGKTNLLTEPWVTEIAKRHQKTCAQIFAILFATRSDRYPQIFKAASNQRKHTLTHPLPSDDSRRGLCENTAHYPMNYVILDSFVHKLTIKCSTFELSKEDMHQLNTSGLDERQFRFENGKTNLLTEPWVTEIAKRHQKTCAQILLRYCLQRGLIVIPKSSKPHRIKENIHVFDFELSKEDMHQLNTSGLDERQFRFEKYVVFD
ncbi:hypothetical protein AHF37_01797 [Paragonimus kellicotti]|nr:hypothetical protein AHF37_01797 [Paragonimus kellicotti]